jgi:hypothetical protein
MKRNPASSHLLFLLLLNAAACLSGFAQSLAPAPRDLSKQPTLYLVGYAHLDTQWRWDYVRTIEKYLPATLQKTSGSSRSTRITFSTLREQTVTG